MNATAVAALPEHFALLVDDKSAPAPWPEGFFEMTEADGTVFGTAHYCSGCKVITTRTGDAVRHCGRVDVRPKGWLKSKLFPKVRMSGNLGYRSNRIFST